MTHHTTVIMDNNANWVTSGTIVGEILTLLSMRVEICANLREFAPMRRFDRKLQEHLFCVSGKELAQFTRLSKWERRSSAAVLVDLSWAARNVNVCSSNLKTSDPIKLFFCECGKCCLKYVSALVGIRVFRISVDPRPEAVFLVYFFFHRSLIIQLLIIREGENRKLPLSAAKR